MKEEQDIFFWSRKDKYGLFSNFARTPITIDGIEYKTVEHYYQAMKTSRPMEQEMIRNCEKPLEAKLAGYHVTLRKDWDSLKEHYMLRGLREKFLRYPGLAKLLLNTGDANLHENSPWDKYWGYVKGEGLDRLGKLLMQVREELRNA